MAREHRIDRLGPAALLVASSEQLVIKTAAACTTQDVPQIEDLECRQVAPGVIRAAISPGAGTGAEVAAQRLLSLRGRLDIQGVASAIEWAAESTTTTNHWSESAGIALAVAGTSASPSGGAARMRSSRGSEQGSEHGALAGVSDDDLCREVIRRASDEDLAHELLRRARSKGIGPVDPQSDGTTATTSGFTAK
jgi:hypothetical protein